MLKPSLVLLIQKYLAEKKSVNEIMSLTGVAKQTVYNIKYGKNTKKARIEKEPKPERIVFPDPESIGPFGRCPSCGGLVQLPCHKCFVDKRERGKEELQYEVDHRRDLFSDRSLSYVRQTGTRPDGLVQGRIALVGRGNVVLLHSLASVHAEGRCDLVVVRERPQMRLELLQPIWRNA